MKVLYTALQEIVSIYPVLSPPNLSPAQSNRVCNALALLQVKPFHSLYLCYLNFDFSVFILELVGARTKAETFVKVIDKICL